MFRPIRSFLSTTTRRSKRKRDSVRQRKRNVSAKNDLLSDTSLERLDRTLERHKTIRPVNVRRLLARIGHTLKHTPQIQSYLRHLLHLGSSEPESKRIDDQFTSALMLTSSRSVEPDDMTRLISAIRLSQRGRTEAADSLLASLNRPQLFCDSSSSYASVPLGLSESESLEFLSKAFINEHYDLAMNFFRLLVQESKASSSHVDLMLSTLPPRWDDIGEVLELVSCYSSSSLSPSPTTCSRLLHLLLPPPPPPRPRSSSSQQERPSQQQFEKEKKSDSLQLLESMCTASKATDMHEREIRSEFSYAYNFFCNLLNEGVVDSRHVNLMLRHARTGRDAERVANISSERGLLLDISNQYLVLSKLIEDGDEERAVRGVSLFFFTLTLSSHSYLTYITHSSYPCHFLVSLARK